MIALLDASSADDVMSTLALAADRQHLMTFDPTEPGPLSHAADRKHSMSSFVFRLRNSLSFCLGIRSDTLLPNFLGVECIRWGLLQSMIPSFVSLSVTRAGCAETAEQINFLFVVETPGAPRNIVLDGGLHPHGEGGGDCQITLTSCWLLF